MEIGRNAVLMATMMSTLACGENGDSRETPGTSSGETEGGETEGGETEGGETEGDETEGSETGETSVTPEFQPCTIDVSNIGASCSASDPSSCDGADIAQNYALWPDPYACYVCADGVTLLKGSACETGGVDLVWNETNEQCILNGQGYPIEAAHTCSSGHYAEGVTPEIYSALASDWHEIAVGRGTPVPQENAGADAYVVDITLEDGEEIEAAVSMGHGVLDGKCGDTFLVRVGAKYVLLLQTDVRAWSLELSPGANTWLDPANVGGTCTIPEVRKIDASFVIEQMFD